MRPRGRFLTTLVFAVSTSVCAATPWRVPDAPYRLTLTAAAGPYRRTDALVVTPLPADKLAAPARAAGFLDVVSLKLREAKDGAAVPCDYVDGNLIFRMSGETAPLSKRTYRLYFNVVARKPASMDRRGAVLKEGEVVPGVNLVANPSFEAPVRDAAGAVLTPEQIAGIVRANLAPDPGMEKGEWGLPSAKAPAKVALEKGAGRNGGVGLVIEAKGDGPALTGVVASPVFKVKPKTFYRFAVWQWLDKKPPTGGLFPKLVFLDENKKYVANVNAYPARKGVFGSWRPLNYYGRSPASARSARIEIRFKGLGDTRCVFDDFRVGEKVSPPHWNAMYHFADPAMEMMVVGGDASDGERAMRISTSAFGKRCTAVVAGDRLPLKPNTTYVGGGDIKVVKPGAAMVISLKVYDKDGKVASKSHSAFMTGPHRAAAAGGWEPAKGGAKTPANAAWGQMVLSVGWGQGAALFDRIYLREAPSGEAVKVTAGAVEKR